MLQKKKLLDCYPSAKQCLRNPNPQLTGYPLAIGVVRMHVEVEFVFDHPIWRHARAESQRGKEIVTVIFLDDVADGRQGYRILTRSFGGGHVVERLRGPWIAVTGLILVKKGLHLLK